MDTKIKEIEKKQEKKFEAIKLMREIRDEISLEIMDMSYEEERAYLDKLIAKGPTKSR